MERLQYRFNAVNQPRPPDDYLNTVFCVWEFSYLIKKHSFSCRLYKDLLHFKLLIRINPAWKIFSVKEKEKSSYKQFHANIAFILITLSNNLV